MNSQGHNNLSYVDDSGKQWVHFDSMNNFTILPHDFFFSQIPGQIAKANHLK